MTSPSASGGRAGTATAPDYTDQARHSARHALTTLGALSGRRRRWLVALAWLLTAAALFACYLHISRTQPVNSDGAANALQAWDMLHGNLLLHNWWLSDVSFYTTELPEYMLVELVRGLNADVVHVAAALTYTLLVLLAAVLAKGRATGREAAVRMLLAGGILVAPQLGTGAYILLLSPDHVGSTVPVLLIWLLLDRAPRRWWVPVLAGALMTWALIGDGIVLYTGFLPLTTVCAIRTYRAVVVRREPGTEHRYELGLILAALVAAELSTQLLVLIHSIGGFLVWPVSPLLAVSGQMPRHLAYTAHGLFVLFGADFFGRKVSFVALLILLHLAGLALAGWAVCAGVRRFFSTDGLVDQVLVAGVLIGLTIYVLGKRVSDINSTREFAEVLPFAAVLAGRLLAPRLMQARLVPALAAGAGRLPGQPRPGGGRRAGAADEPATGELAGRARPPLRAEHLLAVQRRQPDHRGACHGRAGGNGHQDGGLTGAAGRVGVDRGLVRPAAALRELHRSADQTERAAGLPPARQRGEHVRQASAGVPGGPLPDPGLAPEPAPRTRLNSANPKFPSDS